jgi:hypothetical protein
MMRSLPLRQHLDPESAPVDYTRATASAAGWPSNQRVPASEASQDPAAKQVITLVVEPVGPELLVVQDLLQCCVGL